MICRFFYALAFEGSLDDLLKDGTLEGSLEALLDNGLFDTALEGAFDVKSEGLLVNLLASRSDREVDSFFVSKLNGLLDDALNNIVGWFHGVFITNRNSSDV